jgi:hypothetical protein
MFPYKSNAFHAGYSTRKPIKLRWPLLLIAIALFLGMFAFNEARALKSEYVTDDFITEEYGQVDAIANLFLGRNSVDGRLTEKEIKALSGNKHQPISEARKLTRRELYSLFEAKLPKLFNFERAKTVQISKHNLEIDPKTLSKYASEQIKEGKFPDEEFCGGDEYYKAEVNGLIREIGNQGVTNVLNPIGDINNDEFDDLLVSQLRFYFDEELNFENQDRFLQVPAILIWNQQTNSYDSSFSGFEYPTKRKLSDSLWVRHVEHADFDNDGFEDFILADAGTDFRPECGYTNRLYRNIEGSDLEEIPLPLEVNDYTHAFSVGDIDGDGDIDIAVVNSPYANSKKQKLCKSIYGRSTVNYSYFLENTGEMKFKPHKFNENKKKRLFWSARIHRTDSSKTTFMILGEAGEGWHNNEKSRVTIARIKKSMGGKFSIKDSHYIHPPKYLGTGSMAIEFEMFDITGDGKEELFISWQFMTPSFELVEYYNLSNRVQGGQYIQVIQNPFSKTNKDITAEVFYYSQPLNIRGRGSWCVEMYARDIDNDGDTDLMCSSFDQWTRINGNITPHAEPVPIFYRNENSKLKGQFFENEVLNKNKWFIPVRHKDINRMAQVEPFSCDEMYVEVSEIVN